MKALLVALALANLPPPPPDTCKDTGAGSACKTRRQTDGVCAPARCPMTEFSAKGSKTTMVDCLTCQVADGGTK